MPTVELELGLTKPQQAIFDYEGPARFHAVTAGRRFGKTRGAANKCIEWCIDGMGPILWGDTVTTNLTKYVERYFLPTIKDLPHQWRQQDKQLTICGTEIDFRSSERPENWEGFGYRRIILNEAGIILQDRYLYTNAVLPMMMDFPDAQLYALGTPKGKLLKDGSEHPFYTLYKAAQEGSPEHRSLTYSSYDNPLLRPEDVKELEEEIAAMAPEQVAQEIYGQFIDQTEGHLFAFAFSKEKHVKPCEYLPGRPVYASIDFNVEPFCASLWHMWEDKEGAHAHCFHEISINSGTIDEMAQRIRAKVGHITQLEVTGDRGGASRRIGINSNVSMFDDLARVLRLSNRQLALPPNPPHLQSREDCNFVLTHYPDFRIDPSCTKLILDMQTVVVDDKGSIAKQDRKKAAQQADHVDCLRYFVNTYLYRWLKQRRNALHRPS